MFWKVEGRTGLYILFKTVCDVYGLIPEDNYTIPVEAEGVEPPSETKSSIPPLILKREPSEPAPQEMDNATVIEGFSDHTLSTAGTTKRHRHSPSVGATAVHTVVEEAEEEEEQPKDQSRPLTQIFESTEDGDVTAIEDLQETKDESKANEEPAPTGAKETKTKAAKADAESTEKEANDKAEAKSSETAPETTGKAAAQEDEKKAKKGDDAAESAEAPAATGK